MNMLERVYSLGRNLEHDPASRGFRAALAPVVLTVSHYHYGVALDQGQLGSCTGNAMAQCLNTKPLGIRGGKRLSETDAVDLYSQATQVDEYSGSYPPEDTGSSGLAVAKAAITLGYINAYHHAFGIDEVLAALTLGPVIVGTNWYEGMFTPTRDFVTPTGKIAGGHEYLLLGLNTKHKTVTALNSWGTGWGMHGRFKMTWPTLDRLLSEDGDCTVPIRS